MALEFVPYNHHEAPVLPEDWRSNEAGTVWYFREQSYNYPIPGVDYDDSYDEDDFQFETEEQAEMSAALDACRFITGLENIWPCPLIKRAGVKRAVWTVRGLTIDLIRIGRVLKEELQRQAPHLHCYIRIDDDDCEAKFIVSFKTDQMLWLAAYAGKYRGHADDGFYGRLLTDEAFGEALNLNFNFTRFHSILWVLEEDSDEEEEEHDDPSPPAEPEGRSDEDSDDPK